MIRLVTISRISKEKGFERMLKMEQMLIDSGCQFVWDCFGDVSTPYARQLVNKFRQVNFKGITNKPKEVLKNYDYLVQVSDTEGFAYSIYEAISQRVPVIATDFPAIHETLKNGVNGHILKMDLSDFSADRIKSIPVIKKFKEKSTEKDWINFLNMNKIQKGNKPQVSKTKSTDTVLVEVTKRYHDTQLNQTKKVGDTFKTSPERAGILVKENVARISQKVDKVVSSKDGISNSPGENQ